MNNLRWRSRLVLVAATAAACLLASACGPSPTSGGGGNGKTTTVKMVLWPGPEGDAMKKVVNDYNTGEGKKQGVHVDMILLSRTDTFAKEATEMSTKSPNIDVYFTASYIVGQHAPYLQPLSRIDTSNYFPVTVKGLTVNSKLYALPLDISSHFLYYRKDLIGKLMSSSSERATYTKIAQRVLGEPLAPKQPQDWTWKDFLATAAFFTRQYNPDSPTKYGTEIQAKNLEFNTMLWDDILWSYGGSWVGPNGKVDLTTPDARKAMQVYANAFSKGLTSPDAAQAEFPETQAALKSGNAAFALQWSAGYAELNDPAKSPKTAGKIGVAPVPGPSHRTHVHTLAVGLNKYSHHKAAALKWLSFLATPKAMTLYARAGGIPSMPSVLKHDTKINPLFADIASSVSRYGFTEPALPKKNQIFVQLAAKLSPGWVGSEPVTTALANAQQAASSLANQ